MASQSLEIEFVGVNAAAPDHNQIVLHHGESHIVLSPCKSYEGATHAIVCDYDEDDWRAWKWYVKRDIPLYAEGAICEALKHTEIGKHLIPFTKPLKINSLQLHVLKAPVAPRQPAAGVMIPEYKVCIVPELPTYISQALIKAFGYPPKHIIVGIGSFEKSNHKISFKDFKEQIKRVLEPPEKGILSLTLTNFRKDLRAHKSSVIRELKEIFPDVPIVWAEKGMKISVSRDGTDFEISSQTHRDGREAKEKACPIHSSLPSCKKLNLVENNVIREKLHLDEFRSEGVDFDLCYDEETEILTENGFKFFKDLEPGEKVATLNPKTGYLEYQTPIHYYEFDYNGPMLLFENKYCSLCVTPNHKLWVQEGRNPNNKFQLKTFSEIKTKEFHMTSFVKWKGEDIKEFHLQPVWHNSHKEYYGGTSIPFENYIKFMAWFLSEGSAWKERNSHYKISIANTNPEFKREIEQICKSIGYGKFYNNSSFIICSKALYEYLKQFGKAKEKFIPNIIKCASPELLRLFIETYAKGDGTKNKSGTLVIWTSSSRMRDDLQEIILKAGWASTARWHEKRKAWTISINKNLKNIWSRHSEVKIINYNGKIYDVTVPNHILVVRRHGKIVLSGNSHPHERWQELIMDLRILGNSAFPRLLKGQRWGDWTLADVKRYFAKIIDVLRSECKFPWIPPFGEHSKLYKQYYGRDPKRAAKSSFWKLYKEAERYMKTKPPKSLEEAKEWDRERKSLIKTKSLKPGWYSDVKPKYRFEIDLLESDLAHLGWDKKTLLVDPKWDGLRLTLGKIKGKGFAWVDPEDLKERSPDVTDRVPEIIKEIEEHWPDNTICDAELIAMDFPEVLHRTVALAMLRTKEPAENFKDYLYAAVFDVMYFKGEEVEHKPLKDRIEILKQIPRSDHILVERVSAKIVPGGFAYLCHNPKEVRQAWNLIVSDKAVKHKGEYIRKAAEGVMIKLWEEDTRAKQQNPAWCLKGDTYILTDEGFRMIKTIKPGDRVLCADGKFHRVKRVFKKPFDGREICEIKGGIPKARVTHDHLLLTKQGWLEAENIKDTSILVRPELREEITEKFPEEVTLEIFGYKKTIKLDYEMMKAIGFILAEGQLTTGKTNKYYNQGVVVRINPEVTEYKWFKATIENRLGVPVNEIRIKDQNIIRLEFQDPPFASWIHDTFVSKYGKNIPGKAVRIKLPLSLANAREEQLKGLLEGFWLGDGYHSDRIKGLRISTSSSYFAGTLYLICRLKGWDVTVHFRKTKFNGERKHDNWTIYIKTDGVIQRKRVEIENIGTQNFGKSGRTDYLYDLEIEGADNYSNGEVVFHNSKQKIWRECDLVVLARHTVKGTKDVFNYYLGIDISPEYAAKLLDDKKLKKWVVALDGDKLITGVSEIRNLLKKQAKVRYLIYYGKSDNTKLKLRVGDILRVASEEVIRYENEAHPEAPLFRGYINRAMEPIPEKHVSDSLDVFNRLSLLEPKRVPIEELMRWHQESIKEKSFKSRGLYLPEPHARLIAEGKKVLILKDRKYDIADEIFLFFDHDKAYGYLLLGDPFVINSHKEFLALQPLHHVTEEEYKKWKFAIPIYAYPIREVMRFPHPKKISVPKGVQNFLDDAHEYIVDEKSLEGSIAFVGDRPVMILSSASEVHENEQNLGDMTYNI
ncbi:MAG: DNA ligase [Methanophagales virus PBV299]|uniref:DNA ligase n=1 Tax=Methanophagales virus PBV299 TaxID=2987730 RepID=A0ABY6GLM3_9CAUD|nr:MAG: DNA ligase [Methanophagales virus PBV299]UYL64847.1 MAG: DNA ligase [Methanophagales virus PBV299]